MSPLGLAVHGDQNKAATEMFQTAIPAGSRLMCPGISESHF
jgi:hypothetical protein